MPLAWRSATAAQGREHFVLADAAYRYKEGSSLSDWMWRAKRAHSLEADLKALNTGTMV